MCILFEHHMVLVQWFFSSLSGLSIQNTGRLIFMEMSLSFYSHKIYFYFAIITSNLIEQKMASDFYVLR